MKIRIDVRSSVPFYRQIVDQVKHAIQEGKLRQGDRLPTIRQLAVDLVVNINVVIRAYREMENEGVIDTQLGSGVFINNRPSGIERLDMKRMVCQLLV